MWDSDRLHSCIHSMRHVVCWIVVHHYHYHHHPQWHKKPSHLLIIWLVVLVWNGSFSRVSNVCCETHIESTWKVDVLQLQKSQFCTTQALTMAFHTVYHFCLYPFSISTPSFHLFISYKHLIYLNTTERLRLNSACVSWFWSNLSTFTQPITFPLNFTTNIAI